METVPKTVTYTGRFGPVCVLKRFNFFKTVFKLLKWFLILQINPNRLMAFSEWKTLLVFSWSMVAVVSIGFGTLAALCLFGKEKDLPAVFSLMMLDHVVFLAMCGMVVSLVEFSMSLFVAYLGFCADHRQKEAENMMLTCAAVVKKLSQEGDECNAYEGFIKSMTELVKLKIEKHQSESVKTAGSCVGSTDSVEINAVKSKDDISPLSDTSSSRSVAFTHSD